MSLHWPLPEHAGVQVQGHRGARGLAPESTAASFRAAFEAGVTGVEFDVRLTRDGAVIVWHDPSVQPEKCRSTGEDLTDALFADLSLAQVRTLDIGSQVLPEFPEQIPAPGAQILTFDELLDEFADTQPDLWWTIELKVDPRDPGEVASRAQLVESVIASVHRAGIGRRCFIHSFDWAVLDLARDLDPDLLRSALAMPGHTYQAGSGWLGSVRFEDHGDDLAGAAHAVGAQVISPYFAACTPQFVARAHDLGLGVLPWTVNEPEQMRALVEAGVDGFVTDYPDRAATVLAEVTDTTGTAESADPEPA